VILPDRSFIRDDFGPFTPGFVIVPYGDSASIESDHANTAAVMLEPIQGKQATMPPEGYLKGCRDLQEK
jgi:ornithine--oxo-acid transaminase